jgi:putative phosphoribosyl transferase
MSQPTPNRAKIESMFARDAIFENRCDAGRRLAARLTHYRRHPQVTLLALPRGGVPVAYEIARALALPLDIFLVRKLGVPGQEELAMGAIASGGIRVLNPEVICAFQIPDSDIDAATARETLELERRERDYRGALPQQSPSGRIAVLIDDGLATGSTMRAAIAALRAQNAAKIVVAVPVAPPQTCAEIAARVDELICLESPATFETVSEHYRDFSQTSDAEVRHFLRMGNENAHQNVTQVLQ